MTGYSYENGMSNNAVDAYSCGIRPLSRFTANDLKVAGWTETLRLAKHLAKKGIWSTSEYHHTGGTWYNETDFYDSAELVEAWHDLGDEEKVDLKKQLTKNQTPAEVLVFGTYSTWGGSRRHPKFLGSMGFTGIKIENWIYLDGGGRKKANGNNINYHLKTS